MPYCVLGNTLKKFHQKKVLLRVDWNVPFDEKNEIDEFRIRSSLQTIEYLLKQGAVVIIVTHWSRPCGFEYQYSTIHFIKILKRYGYDIVFISTISLIESCLSGGKRIFLLENIRFLPHEKNCSQLLARKLFSCVDIFIQDGFGILAKKACVTTVLPLLFKQENKYIGCLVENELRVLDEMRSTDFSKNAVLIGGAKVPEKVMALQGALSVACKILLMPPLLATYQAALGEKSDDTTVIYKDLFPFIREFIVQAKRKNVDIVVPIDFQVKTAQGHYTFVNSKTLERESQIIGIGPATIALYHDALRNMKYVFMTGISGFVAQKMSWYTGLMLFNAIGANTKRIIAGGDSVALMQSIVGVQPYNTTFLTGGSASFAYLGSGTLLGLYPFKKEDTILKG